MNQVDPVDRDLELWFHETARPRTPDYTSDILRQTALARQRPRWTFLERWLPKSVTLDRVPIQPLPWRAMGVLVVLALLATVAVAIYVGSRPKVPAPFGAAANGLVAYASGGDIYTVEPATGERRLVIAGDTEDHDPRWSLDGTRLAFVRDIEAGSTLVTTSSDGSNQVVAKMVEGVRIDPDGIAWSPDGRHVALAADVGDSPVVYVVDAVDGSLTTLAIDRQLEVYWRPPNGRQLMFSGADATGVGLYLVSLEHGTQVRLSASSQPEAMLRPLGWTPDGHRFVWSDHGSVTHVTDATTGEDTVIAVAFGHVSNDGTRIAGLLGEGEDQRVCVASIDGGPCIRIGDGSTLYEGTHHEGLYWSPDDRWIITRPGAEGVAVILDANGVVGRQPSWIADGAESWQRTAP
jgi:Tol biopolymer transport system component